MAKDEQPRETAREEAEVDREGAAPRGWRARLRRMEGLSALRRLVMLAGLVVALGALAFALWPYKVAGQECSPALFQVLDRERLTPPAAPGQPPGPPVTRPPSPVFGGKPGPLPPGVLKPCTEEAKQRLYKAGPVALIALLGVFGASRILS